MTIVARSIETKEDFDAVALELVRKGYDTMDIARLMHIGLDAKAKAEASAAIDRAREREVRK